MKTETAQLLMQRLTSLLEAQDSLSSVIDSIEDAAERKQFRYAIATVSTESYMQIRMPLLRLHPELNPDATQSLQSAEQA